MAELVPVFDSLEAVYPGKGRVNLIGEHIDYEGYGVLPMAIQQDTVVAAAVAADGMLRISDVDATRYPAVQFGADPGQAVDVANHSWANYFLAAYKGVFDWLAEKGLPAPQPTGLQVVIHGVVPTGAGVSSSSAMVCACSLAVLAAYNIPAAKAEVADFACQAERYVGVTSGGMDQAISMMGAPGLAKFIEFNPVRAADVVLPKGITFVIANSLAVSNKAESAPRRYNLRVVECRLAAQVMAHALGVPPEQVAQVRTLRDVEPLIIERYGQDGQEAAVRALLHGGAYSQKEVESLLGLGLEQQYAGQPAPLLVLKVARDTGFMLQSRALHVYSEARRVLEFAEVARSGVDGCVNQLAQLMDASHASCRDLYDCSCPELDDLVTMAKACGALGARLTGAGWGGCAVAIMYDSDAASFLSLLRTRYFAKSIALGRIKAENLSEVLFESKPSSGAAILRLAL